MAAAHRSEGAVCRPWRSRTFDTTAYLVVVLLAMAVVIGPSNLAWSERFVSWAQFDGDAPLVPGDHLQLTYELWLWHDSLTGGGHAPWTDPYLFGSEGGGMAVIFGWPIVVATLPVSLAWGPVAAYNAAVYMGFLLAALFAAAWGRSLGLSLVAAGATGLAFAFAPFRVVQSVGHANALLAWMFPVLACCLERALRGDERTASRWAWIAVMTQVSIVLAGEMHHAVFAALFSGAYVLIRARRTPRRRIRRLLVPAAAGVVGTTLAAALLYVVAIRPSGASGGRTIDEAAHFAPRLVDFVRPGLQAQHYERYVYVGAVVSIGALAAIGAAAFRARHRAMVAVLVAGVAFCVWFSTAPGFVNWKPLQASYRLVPFLSFSRTPGRLMVLGALLLAALLGLGVEALGHRVRRWMLVPLAVVMAIDLPAPLFEDLGAGGNPYEGLARGATILEFPVYHPGHSDASVYSMYVVRHPSPRVGGYFVIVPEARDEPRQWADQLQADIGDGCRWGPLVDRAGIRYVAAHPYLLPPSEGHRLVASLRAVPGLHELEGRHGVTLFEVASEDFVCPEREGK